MTPEFFVSIAAALFTAGSLVFVGITTSHTKRQADASIAQANSAIEQTSIQRQLREDAAQPYVWADIKSGGASGSTLTIVVGNSGPTVATDVRVQIDPPLTLTEGHDGHEDLDGILRHGIHSIAPGRQMRWRIGEHHGANAVVEAERSTPRTIRVTGRGPFGELTPLEYVVDFGDFCCSFVDEGGSLYRVAEEIKKISSSLTSSVGYVASAVEDLGTPRA
ncbi:hypothetical protein SAMN05216410_1068 [Sanguibacter gelidistatuariae]|uniref:Uncharacterized protein n=1 Tax=Sanguibacter gelidistatuariae TaxID=1814289 RepID=A0A1G6HKM4_9MICO|nr:hypothetical protein [Sanguibacter gelidistatuariae]SDB93996.1 hypothetical protein SAMN05216410_1068 [Sanguibacter gelidistatuariae]